MENSRKVTHGCIIATLKLYLPDGKEAKASPTIVNSTSNPALLSLSLPTQDLYQLNQYIQEALAREQVYWNIFYYKQKKMHWYFEQFILKSKLAASIRNNVKD